MEIDTGFKVFFEGKYYLPDRKGKYRCPYKCGDPNYPQPGWSTQKGFLKHMGECKAKPEPVLVWVPKPKDPPEWFADCPDCDSPIYKMTSCWWMPDKIVCMDCHFPYLEVERGHMEPAGLDIPGITLEG